MAKVWLVTGASRGLGSEITRAALDAGETVVATARSDTALRGAWGTNVIACISSRPISPTPKLRTWLPPRPRRGSERSKF